MKNRHSKKHKKSKKKKEVEISFDNIMNNYKCSKFVLSDSSKGSYLGVDKKRERKLNKNSFVSPKFRKLKRWGWSNEGFKKSTVAGAVPNVALFSSFIPNTIGENIELPEPVYTMTMQSEEDYPRK